MVSPSPYILLIQTDKSDVGACEQEIWPDYDKFMCEDAK